MRPWIFALALVACLGFPTRAAAVDIVVTRFDDPPPNACLSGDCSLREAVMLSNSTPGSDRIFLAAGTYALTLLGSGDDAGDLDVNTGELTILGMGATQTIIDAAAANDRVFTIVGANPFLMAGLTVRNGNVSSDPGGGIFLRADLTLVDCVVENNTTSTTGGGIFAFAGSLTLIRTVVRNNSAGSQGGGILANVPVRSSFSIITDNTAAFGGGFFLDGPAAAFRLEDTTVAMNQSTVGDGGGVFLRTGTLSVERSTIAANRAQISGGGIYNLDGMLTVTSSTVSENRAKVNGGGVFNGETTLLLSSTIAVNIADDDVNGSGNGGGIFNSSSVAGSVTSLNTLIGDNFDRTVTGPRHLDCTGILTSAGHNLLEDLTGCTFVPTTGDITSQDPALAALADNGGPTLTRALLAGSPAIEAGDPTGCDDAFSIPLAKDQRGASRSFDGDGDGTARCDIGAFELVPGFLFADGFESGNAGFWSAVVP